MSVLRDRDYYRGLKQALHNRMAERKLAWSSSFSFRWLSQLFYVLLFSAILPPILISHSLVSGSVQESLSRLTLCSLGFGGIIYSLVYITLVNGRSSTLLSNTPVTNRLALWHTLRGLVPSSIIVIVVITAISHAAHHDLEVSQWPILATILSVYLSFALSFFTASLISLRVSILWILLVSVTLPISLLILSWVPGGTGLLKSISHWLVNVVPSGWPIDCIRGNTTPDYLWLKILLALALLIMGTYYLWHFLQSWKCPRPEWDDEDEFDLDEYLDEIDPTPQDKEGLRAHVSKHYETLQAAWQEPEQKHGWLETVLLMVSSERQQLIIRCLGLPRYTRSLYRAILLCAISTLIFTYSPPSFFLHSLIRIIALLAMGYAVLMVAPISTLSRLLTGRLDLNMQTEAPVCTLIPVSIIDIVRLQLTEWWVRGLTTIPLAMFALWMFYHGRGGATPTSESLFIVGYQVIFFLLAIPAVGFSWAIFFGSDTNNLRSSRAIHTLLVLLLLAIHMIFVGCVLLFLPNYMVTKVAWKIIVAITISSIPLFLFSIHHYRSSKTDMTYPASLD